MDSKIQLIPLPDDFHGRIETGPVQFGDDWPGTFIRGDSAAYYAMTINTILEKYGDSMDPIMQRVPLNNLMIALNGSNIHFSDNT